MPKNLALLNILFFTLWGFVICSTTKADQTEILVNFEDGYTHGWSVNGYNRITPHNGNPGPHLAIKFYEMFIIDIRNTTHDGFIGDYLAREPINLSIDIKTNSITYKGREVPRELILELRDSSQPSSSGFPYVSVWTSLGTLAAPGPYEEARWETYAVDIPILNDQVLANGMPEGWGGYGHEDPNTYELILPEDRTFASVLQNVTEIHFATQVPGQFYGYTNFDLDIDNIRILSQQ